MSSKETSSKDQKPPTEKNEQVESNGNDISYDLTIKRYEQDITRNQHLDNKAGTQIGFSGIIIAILSFVIGSMDYDQILTNEYIGFFGWGLGILLFSVCIGIIVLSPFKKNLSVFNPEKFFDKYDGETDERNQALYAYFDMIDDVESVNNRKSTLLYVGNVSTMLGLGISFISFLLVFGIITIK